MAHCIRTGSPEVMQGTAEQISTSRRWRAPSSSGSSTRLGHQVAMELLKQCKASSGLPCSTLRLASTCTTNRLCSAFTCDILGETGTPYGAHVQAATTMSALRHAKQSVAPLESAAMGPVVKGGPPASALGCSGQPGQPSGATPRSHQLPPGPPRLTPSAPLPGSTARCTAAPAAALHHLPLHPAHRHSAYDKHIQLGTLGRNTISYCLPDKRACCQGECSNDDAL